MTNKSLETLLVRVFRVAAYNICWGSVVVLFPNLWFDLFHLPRINYPFVMSGLGCVSACTDTATG
jgi:hypothetical protein